VDIIKGKVKQPFNVICLAPPGVGKSTWASKAPKPIFLGFEETSELDVDRFPIPKTYSEFASQLDYLTKNPKDYKTIVIDSIDTVERALHLEITTKEEKPMKNCMGGYGAAYDYAETRLKLDVKDKLKFLRDVKGFNIIIIGHVTAKTKTDPIQALTYDTFVPNLHHKAQSLFVDWVQCCFFATFVTAPVQDENSKKVFAASQGKRKMLCEARPGVYAKNRYNMPYEVPFEFDVFFKHYEDFYAGKEPLEKDIKESIQGLLQNKDEDLKSKVNAAVAKAKSVTELNKIRERLANV
jgi:hypothetical protein